MSSIPDARTPRQCGIRPYPARCRVAISERPYLSLHLSSREVANTGNRIFLYCPVRRKLSFLVSQQTEATVFDTLVENMENKQHETGFFSCQRKILIEEKPVSAPPAFSPSGQDAGGISRGRAREARGESCFSRASSVPFRALPEHGEGE